MICWHCVCGRRGEGDCRLVCGNVCVNSVNVRMYICVFCYSCLLLIPSLQLSESTDHQEEKVRLYRALGQTDKEDVLSKCHEYSLSVSDMAKLVETGGSREEVGWG